MCQFYQSVYFSNFRVEILIVVFSFGLKMNQMTNMIIIYLGYRELFSEEPTIIWMGHYLEKRSALTEKYLI